MKRMSESVAYEAAEYLRGADVILRPIIQEHGLCTIRPNTNYYQELVDAIISQQLSVYAARSIENRFRELFGRVFPEPNQILSTNVEALRSIGFSRAKATYVLDLAQHIVEGKVQFDHLDALDNEAVTRELTAVKGIGEWTAHMFLMFCMGRTDILPVGDLGIRNGIKKLYGLSELPSATQIIEIARTNQWHPYESVASWYVWQALDNTPQI
jgi:DNA-3-methyladenine glycosylase II